VAIVIIQDWLEPETERSTKNYDAVTEKLAAQGPIEGLIVHTAGWSGNGFRILEVWETRGHYERFVAERVMPLLLEQEGSDPTPPTETSYELHNVIVP
jgi:hypothetical protein